MTLRDLITISTGNLTRMKLRTVLTVAGVVVAIGTFVAMLSFGAGNQRYVTDQFEALGLFHTMQVYPVEKRRRNEPTLWPSSIRRSWAGCHVAGCETGVPV